MSEVAQTAERQRVLVVDDQVDFTRGVKRLVEGNYPAVEVLTAHSGDEALDLLSRVPVQLMLTDLRMPAMDGLDLLRKAQGMRPELSAVMLTAHGSIEAAVDALKAGAYDFLTKPVEPEQLFRVVEKGLERGRLLDENRRLKRLLERRGRVMIGQSPVMERLRQAIGAVAQSDYTVLVLGESGTGKELAARMVHDLSPRRDGAFVAVNCPAIPGELLESELFGHVRGAFTGADRDREGLFAKADGGTLHLDEIGDIPMGTQTKLLRVLQEGEIRPVGSDVSRTVDVRVVASTNQDLAAKIADKTFREDLYYRLNVLMLVVPRLDERRDDIPLLARFFLQEACKEMGLPDRQVDETVLAHLSGRSWPGNVRELQNFMRKLAVFSSGDAVTMSSVGLVDNGPGWEPVAGEKGVAPYKEAKAALLEGFTKGYMRDALASAKGNVSQVARVSGLSRVAVQKILARFDIDPAGFK